MSDLFKPREGRCVRRTLTEGINDIHLTKRKSIAWPV
jgi:hypothetical protein